MLRVIAIFLLLLGLAWAAPACAQDDEQDVSLGDLARTLRKSKPAEDPAVIDNDNLSLMMDKAEAERLNGKPVFAIDPGGRTFRMISPDGTCSLSFDARVTALISSPNTATQIPRYELVDLNGSASIHDGALEVSIHNGTPWEVSEIVVGVTVLSTQPETRKTSPDQEAAKLLGEDDVQIPNEKQPDRTVLLHLKATAAPDSTTVFRGDLNTEFGEIGEEFGPNSDWHWALLSARGIPPAAPTTIPDLASGPLSPESQSSGITLTGIPPGEQTNASATSASPITVPGVGQSQSSNSPSAPPQTAPRQQPTDSVAPIAPTHP